MATYDKYTEPQLKVAKEECKMALADARRDMNKARFREERESASSRVGYARDELREIEEALQAHRIQRQSPASPTQPPGNQYQPATQAELRSSDVSERSVFNKVFNRWCRNNRIGKSPEFTIELHWDLDGRHYLGQFNHVTQGFRVWAQIDRPIDETIEFHGRYYLPCNSVQEMIRIQGL